MTGQELTDKPAATTNAAQTEFEGESISNRVFETLSTLTRVQPSITSEDFTGATMRGPNVALGLESKLRAHEAFRTNRPELTEHQIDALFLDTQETIEDSVVDAIRQPAANMVRARLQELGLEPSASALIAEDFEFGSVHAPDLEASDFAALQEIAKSRVATHIASQLESLGIAPDDSAAFRVAKGGLSYTTNPREFDSSRQSDVIELSE